ncbi:hypothetical protein THARTR1_00353 [Trichoderma harzianum]|uniref:Nucleoside phosphorylase domain-containing protein n=1 Tax=Trichoderma harzianum TaxID=5544 RepID=A0A2K0URB9_TRIHA|nr:hypothetical protein THARTR1_00353 [Trichoderma harzianum]
MEALGGATKRALPPADYTVGWICVYTEDQMAARVFLDENHAIPDYLSPRDTNAYSLGKMGGHNIVIAGLPYGEYDVSSAVAVATDMLRSFPNIRIGLIVGIGGTAPSSKHNVRLGDVVVSAPLDRIESGFPYMFGEGMQQRMFDMTGSLIQQQTLVRTAVNRLKAYYQTRGHQIEENISSVLEKFPNLRQMCRQPQSISNELHKSTVNRLLCTEEDYTTSCGNDVWMLVSQPERTQIEDKTSVHYGLIAPKGQVLKDTILQDRVIRDKDVLCLDTIAAGSMYCFPCLAIRGICDYSDSNKNGEWRDYAVMVAAACAKDLLNEISKQEIEDEKRLVDVRSLKELIARSLEKYRDGR